MNILFLYTELAGYTMSCFRELKRSHPGCKIMVIHYPVNPEAPFEFEFSSIGEFHNIKEFENFVSLKNRVAQFNPDKIVVSGWSNRWYMRLCLSYRSRATCILTMDNSWDGSFKQNVLALISRLSLVQLFKKIWVPGKPQVAYALKLGFKPSNILEGFYTCETERFLQIGTRALSDKKFNFPHVILCVARYIPAKNYPLIWEAFTSWKAECSSDWELWCAGTGSGFETRIQHPAIRHLGFVQEKDWPYIISQTGVFILGSKFEPWGVAVHEFAASGYPLILSDQVGASSAFLDQKNGWSFNPFDAAALKEIFRTLNLTGNENLYAMGEESMNLAAAITPRHWVATLLTA